jgi:hypothetical protein
MINDGGTLKKSLYIVIKILVIDDKGILLTILPFPPYISVYITKEEYC